MKKPFLLVFYLYISLSIFAQAQFPISIVNYMPDFEPLDNIDNKNEVLRFHNISQYFSPVDFYLQASDQILMNVKVFPYAYLEAKPKLNDFCIFNVFGHLNISTFFNTNPVSFVLFDRVMLNSFNSDIEVIHYTDDYFIQVHSGKITINIKGNDILIIAGQSILIHQDATWDILQDIDYEIYNHQQLTNFMVNKSNLLNHAQEQFNQLTFDDYAQYIYFYMLTSFFDHL